uniref:G_PROTEIN_RECEP_F1_2 domain-containing protein n=1 Tax=Steinernema glaseri TaxID=37863 RepID=A0A1I7YMZ8_9BILA
MSDNFSFFYNRILDLTAIGSISVKPLCIYIIITKTPKIMRTVSYFLLNELLWNFAGNLLYTLGHLFPMMPALCFRMDGLAGQLMKTEEQQSIYMSAVVVTTVNCCFRFVSTFLFRYVTLAYSNSIARSHRAWSYVFCAVVHISLSLLVVFLFHIWWLPINKYPKGDLPENTHNLSCYLEGGVEAIIVGFLFLCFGGSTLLVTVLAGLCVRELRAKRNLMDWRALRLHNEILKNLLIITATAVMLGGIPLTVAVFYIYNSRLAFAQSIVSILVLLPLNFGTIYAILILTLFKSYRNAVVNIACSLLNVLQRKYAFWKVPNTVSPDNMSAHMDNERY